MFFVLLNFLKRRLRFLINCFASFVNQEGSDCLILTFLLGMCCMLVLRYDWLYLMRICLYHYSSVIPSQFRECHEIEIGSHHDQIT